MKYVIVDTEYTTFPGALESGWADALQHREIVQIAAITVDEGFNELYEMDLLVKPSRNPILSDLFTEITGITQYQVNNFGASFQSAYIVALCEFFGKPVICMNADEAVFRENCRLNTLPFPDTSFHRLRPFMEARGIDLKGLSSGDLHTLTDEPLVGATASADLDVDRLAAGRVHNALHDVRSMAAWLRYAKRKNWLTNVEDLPTGAPTVDPRSSRGQANA